MNFRFNLFIVLWAVFIVSTSSITWSLIDGQVAVETGTFVKALVPEKFGMVAGALAIAMMFPIAGGAIRIVPGLIWVFSAWILFGSIWSLAPIEAFGRGISFGMAVLLAAFAAAAFDAERVFRAIWLFSLFLIGVSVVLASIGSPYGLMGGNHTGLWRGIFVHKNHFGVVLAVFLIVTVFKTGGPSWRWRLAAIGITVPAIAMAGSAAAYLISIAGILFGLFDKWTQKMAVSRALRVVVTLFVLLFGALIGLAFLPDALSLLGRDLTFSGRDVLWRTTWQYAIQTPFGQGYRLGGGDEFLYALQRNAGWSAPSSHNGLLSLILDTGFVGCVLWVIWLFGVILGVSPARTPRQETDVAVSAVAFVMLLNSMVDSAAGPYPSYSFTMLVLLAALSKARSLRDCKMASVSTETTRQVCLQTTK